MGAMVSMSGRRRSVTGFEQAVGDLAKNVHNQSSTNPVSFVEFRKLFTETLGCGSGRGGREGSPGPPAAAHKNLDPEWDAMVRETFRIVDMDRSGAVDEWEARRVLFVLQGRIQNGFQLKLLALVPIGEGRTIEDTFKDGKYSVQTLKEDTVLYRAGSAKRPLGQYFSRQKPSSASSLRAAMAVKDDWDVSGVTLREVFRNRVDTVHTITVPKGTMVFEGEAAGLKEVMDADSVAASVFKGGGQQTFIFRPQDLGADEWSVSSEPLPHGAIWELLEYEPTAICRAAWEGDCAAILAASEQEVSGGSEGFGLTPLHHAVAGQQERAVEALLEAKAAVEQVNHMGLSALHVAALCGHASIISILAKHKHCSVNATDAQLGRCALHFAAMEGEAEAVKVLLEVDGVQASLAGSDGVTALGHASRRGHAEVTRALIAARERLAVDINAPAAPSGTTALQAAVLSGHAAVVTCLLEAGASITPLPDSSSLLVAAIRSGRGQAAAAMVRMRGKECGCGVDPVEGCTPLVLAARSKLGEVVEALVESGEANTAWADEDDVTALHIACRLGDEGMVRAMLQDKAAPVNKQNIHGYTPLYTATALNHVGIVKALLEEKTIKVELSDKQGWTPLHVSAHKGFEEVVQLLLESKAKVKAKNQGATAVELAATPEIRQLLLSYGGEGKGGKKGPGAVGSADSRPEPGG